MALPTQTAGTLITDDLYNAIIDAVNRASPSLQQTVTSLDANGSIQLTTGEETDLVLDGIGAVDVNGCSVPDRSPWPLHIVNVSVSVATLKHEDTTEPTPAKRFLLPGGANYTLGLGEGILLRYVSVPLGARWTSVAK
jgi:hypothetical protein